jgi:cytochrome c556
MLSANLMVSLLGVLVTILIFLIAQLVTAVWWASRITERLANFGEDMKKLVTDSDRTSAALWKKHDEMRQRVERIEKNCVARHGIETHG